MWCRCSRTIDGCVESTCALPLRFVCNHSGLHGEICCLDSDGRTNFKKPLFRREWPHFYAFDVLSIEGEDLTGLPLLDRKRRLLGIMPIVESRLLSLDHIHVRGSDLFRAACELDLEGIVGKWVHGTYRTDGRNLVAENQKSRLYADPRTVTSCSTLRTVVTGALFGPT